jgi:hypothetical protein
MRQRRTKWDRRIWEAYSVESEKLLDFEIRDCLEVPHVVRHNGIAEFQRRGADQQIGQSDSQALCMKAPIDLARAKCNRVVTGSTEISLSSS